MFDALTTAETAERLRALADVLDSAPHAAVETWMVFTVPGYTGDTEEPRIADVDALAAALCLSAEPVGTSGAWYHEADNGDHAFRVRVKTYIPAPARRCACGATCTHSAA